MTSINKSLAIAALFATMFGCAPPPPKLHPVKGSVRVFGRPAGGVYLQFHSLDDKELAKRPDGCKSEADGTFQLLVHGTGSFAITTFWPTVRLEMGEVIEGPDQFHGEFRKVESPVLKIPLAEGENVLPPIDLKPKKLRK